MAKLNYAVLNATLVALVAIGGMVMYFNAQGGAVGAVADYHHYQGEWETASDPGFYALGERQIGPQCMTLTTRDSSSDWGQCCAKSCATTCNSLGFSTAPNAYSFGMDPLERCGKDCLQGCEYHKIRSVSIGFNYRNERTSTTR